MVMEGYEIERLFWLSSALIFGIWVVFFAMRQVERFDRFVRLWQRFAIIATYAILVRLVMVQQPYYVPRKFQCVSAIKQTALGLIMYDLEYDGLPKPGAWETQIAPFTKGPRLTFRPNHGEEFGYSYNSHLSGLRADTLDIQTLLCGESKTNQMNSVIRSKDDLGMHFGGRPVIGYADGHAKWVGLDSSSPTYLHPGDKVPLTFPNPPEPKFEIGKAVQSLQVRFGIFVMALVAGLFYYAWAKELRQKPNDLGTFVLNAVILSFLIGFLALILLPTF